MDSRACENRFVLDSRSKSLKWSMRPSILFLPSQRFKGTGQQGHRDQFKPCPLDPLVWGDSNKPWLVCRPPNQSKIPGQRYQGCRKLMNLMICQKDHHLIKSHHSCRFLQKQPPLWPLDPTQDRLLSKDLCPWPACRQSLASGGIPGSLQARDTHSLIHAGCLL